MDVDDDEYEDGAWWDWSKGKGQSQKGKGKSQKGKGKGKKGKVQNGKADASGAGGHADAAGQPAAGAGGAGGAAGGAGEAGGDGAGCTGGKGGTPMSPTDKVKEAKALMGKVSTAVGTCRKQTITVRLLNVNDQLADQLEKIGNALESVYTQSFGLVSQNKVHETQCKVLEGKATQMLELWEKKNQYAKAILNVKKRQAGALLPFILLVVLLLFPLFPCLLIQTPTPPLPRTREARGRRRAANWPRELGQREL
eukprot:8773834-Pyramimonas_sp.AAC.1